MGEAWVTAGWVAGGMAYAWLAIRAAVPRIPEFPRFLVEVDRKNVLDRPEPRKRSP